MFDVDVKKCDKEGGKDQLWFGVLIHYTKQYKLYSQLHKSGQYTISYG